SIKQLKEEKHALRRSPERKVGQVLLAPYRLPQKLIRGLRKHWPTRGGHQLTEYQQWFERRRAKPEQLQHMRDEARTFIYQPRVSIITPVFNTPLPWLRAAIDSVRAQVYENWELVLSDDKSTDPELLAFLDEVGKTETRI